MVLKSGSKGKIRPNKNQPHRPGNNRAQASEIRPHDKNTVHLDGSTLEGGGQLVRVALTLSAITGTPVHITNIRAGRGGGRSAGGLKESHLAALEVLAEECGAAVGGGQVGSKELLFEPEKQWQRQRQRLRPDGQLAMYRSRTIELQKPGSVWLILQALLPFYLLQSGRTELTFTGGTNVSASMSGDYVQQVLLPTLQKIGSPKVQVEAVQRGWAGNAPQIGEVKVSFIGGSPGDADAQPRKLGDAFEVRDRGSISKIAVTVVAHPESMRTTLLDRLKDEVSRKCPGIQADIVVNEDSHDARRLYILLVAHTSNGWRLGSDYLGTGRALKTQKEADALIEGAARKVTDELLEEVKAGGCVDQYLQDQLVVFQALAAGASAVDAGNGREKGTLHTQTVRWVCQEMLGKLGIEVMEGGACLGSGTYLSQGRMDKVHTDGLEGEENDIDERLAEAAKHMTCNQTGE